MRDRHLYEALVSFPLAQTGGQLTFLDRLCRENNWSRDLGHRAIGEYKRFAYLAMVSPMPVTPSDEVDQVWHLHLLYTRSYWEEMTRLLPKPLHHGPTNGGSGEDAKFGNWYERTKALYESEFGEPPPEDLWPPAEVRFDPRQRFRRLNTTTHWVIPKPGFPLGRGAVAFGAMPVTLPLAGISGVELFSLVVIGWFVLVALVAASARSGDNRKKKAQSDGGGGGDGGSCSSGDGGDSSSGDGGCGDGGGGCGGGGCGGGGCGGGD